MKIGSGDGTAEWESLQVELTSKCNLRCKMCALTTKTTASSAAPGVMNHDVWNAVVNAAASCQEVVIAGYGEPLMDSRCLPFLQQLDALGVNIAISTNGIGISTEVARSVMSLEYLKTINVSIDSPDAKIYRHLRGGSLDRAMQGLGRLIDNAGDINTITVSAVAGGENLESLVDFPRILAALGVRRFNVQGLADYNNYCVEQRLLGDSAAAHVFGQIEDACLDHGIYLDLSAPDRSALELRSPSEAKQRFYDRPSRESAMTRQCTLPWEIPYVDKDGRVFPCCFAASQNEALLGNLPDESMAAVWSGPAYEQFRQDIIEPESTPEICRRCTLPPLGEHPLKRFSARVLNESIRSDGRTVSLTIENTGGETWNPDHMIRVGTAQPRDHGSPVAHPTWLFANRASAINREVGPSERVAVKFGVSPQSVPYEEHFQIVVEGLAWLPATGFSVAVPAARSGRVSRSYRARMRQRLVTRLARPLNGYSAQLIDGGVQRSGNRITAKVRNTGTRAWQPSDHVFLGVKRTPDGAMSLSTPSWISTERPATFAGERVSVGEIASFEFDIDPAGLPSPTSFAVVVESVCWLHDTSFELPATPHQA